MSGLLRQMVLDAPAGLWPLDETSGTQARDVSGNARHGTYTGTVTPGGRSTFLGKAPDFATGYVAVPDNAAFSASGANGLLTIVAWVVADANLNASMIVAKGNVSNYEYRLNGHTDASLHYVASDTGGVTETDFTQAGAFTLGAVTMVGAVYNRTAGTVALVKDGVLGSPQANTKTQGDYGAELEIGRRQDGGGSTWDGSIQYVGIYQSALSATRLLAHYQAGIRAGVVNG